MPLSGRGVLRLVNSHKLGAALGVLIGRQQVRRIREYLGFGQTIVLVARRRP
jgi:hypothetical protein